MVLVSVLCMETVCLMGQSVLPKHSSYYEQRVSLFWSLPIQYGSVIFLGNSITDGGEWQELFPNRAVLNRGISGDTTSGVLDRIQEVIRHQPQKVFLLIGTNDLSRGIPREQVRDNILRIVEKIREGSAVTSVYVQSILPVNERFNKFSSHTKNSYDIQWINSQLKQRATSGNYTYLDVYRILSDDQGRLRTDYTNDGLHLLGKAYIAWADYLHPFID